MNDKHNFTMFIFMCLFKEYYFLLVTSYFSVQHMLSLVCKLWVTKHSQDGHMMVGEVSSCADKKRIILGFVVMAQWVLGSMVLLTVKFFNSLFRFNSE